MAKEDPALDSLLKSILEPETTQPLTTQMVVRQASLFEITVEDLRKVCAKSPGNPKAVAFLASVTGHRLEDKVFVERLDLEAVIKNTDTVVVNSKQMIETAPGTMESVMVQEKILTE